MRTLRLLAVAAAIALAASAAFAQRGSGGRGGQRSNRPGTGDTTEHFVPWKYLEPGVEPDKEPLIVEWFPASREEIDHSQLLDSRALVDYDGECVGLQVVLPEDKVRVDKFGVASERPIVLIVDAKGNVLRSVHNEHGAMRVAAVEKALKEEFETQENRAVADLESANAKAASGDTKSAIELYKHVWDQRCPFPFAGHEAQRELKKLGVVVQEPAAVKPTEALPAPALNKNEKPPKH